MERTLLKFYADWCGPCKIVAPTVEKVASEHGLQVVSVNIDEDRETAERYGVRSIPTLVLLDNDQEIGRHTGANTRTVIESSLGLTA